MARTTSSRSRQRKSRNAVLLPFLRWWGHELAALVPRSLWPRKRPPARMLWVGMQAGALVLWRLAGQKRNPIGRIDLAAGDDADHKITFNALQSRAGIRAIGICLPTSQVLRKEVDLPLAAAENLGQVVGFELGRQTPYTADQAYYDQRVLSEDRDGKRLHVLLGVTPRAPVDDILALLGGWGVSPQAVVVSDELEGSGDCLDFLKPELRPRTGRARYWQAVAMAIVTLALFATWLAIPIWKKRETAMALLTVQERAQQQADAVGALKREQDRLLAEYAYPVERKLATPAKVALLDEMTRILPDNTWLQQLDINEKEVSMQGATRASSRLIGLFEQSALLENASYKAPLVKGRDNEERFHLAAELTPVDLEAALAAQQKLVTFKKPVRVTRKSGKRPAPTAGKWPAQPAGKRP
jgi:general secretion pathway protein L